MRILKWHNNAPHHTRTQHAIQFWMIYHQKIVYAESVCRYYPYFNSNVAAILTLFLRSTDNNNSNQSKPSVGSERDLAIILFCVFEESMKNVLCIDRGWESETYILWFDGVKQWYEVGYACMRSQIENVVETCCHIFSRWIQSFFLCFMWMFVSPHANPPIHCFVCARSRCLEILKCSLCKIAKGTFYMWQTFKSRQGKYFLIEAHSNKRRFLTGCDA